MNKGLTLFFFLSDGAGKFSIITFEEFISIALDASRTVGIYPEMKDPVFINKHVRSPILKKQHLKFTSLSSVFQHKFVLTCYAEIFCEMILICLAAYLCRLIK